MDLPVTRIVSGGQTGADRAALDWALAHGVPHGGWCPEGRLAEDGVIDARYLLRELPGGGYLERTRQNVVDSEATLILNRGELSGGTLATRQFALEAGKPFLLVALDTPATATTFAEARAWLRDHAVAVLNVAGPRETKRPGMYRQTLAFLNGLWRAD